MADNTLLPGIGETYASKDDGLAKIQRILLSDGTDSTSSSDISKTNPLPVHTVPQILSFTANGNGALNETLTPTAGKKWRVVAYKLHLGSAATTSENFVVQIKDAAQARYNTVLLDFDMQSETDKFVMFDGIGLPIAIDTTLDFDYTNTDTNAWGLTVSYLED